MQNNEDCRPEGPCVLGPRGGVRGNQCWGSLWLEGCVRDPRTPWACEAGKFHAWNKTMLILRKNDVRPSLLLILQFVAKMLNFH